MKSIPAGGSHYADGTKVERAIRTYLSEKLPEAARYTVLRTAGSKGAADLIAVRADGTHLWIQSKGGAGIEPWKIGPGEWNKLWDLTTVLAGVLPILATWEPTGPRGGRGPVFRRLTGPRSPGKRLWPIVPFDVEAGAPVYGSGGEWHAEIGKDVFWPDTGPVWSVAQNGIVTAQPFSFQASDGGLAVHGAELFTTMHTGPSAYIA